MDEFETEIKQLIFDDEQELSHSTSSYEAADLKIRIATLNEVLALYQKQGEALYQ